MADQAPTKPRNVELQELVEKFQGFDSKTPKAERDETAKAIRELARKVALDDIVRLDAIANDSSKTAGEKAAARKSANEIRDDLGIAREFAHGSKAPGYRESSRRVSKDQLNALLNLTA